MDLLALARLRLCQYVAELRSYGIAVDERLEIRGGDGFLSYYDHGDGKIYLAIPDLHTSLGQRVRPTDGSGSTSRR